MSGHFPFSGKANRVSVFAFFEAHKFSMQTQEEYYKWWYNWAKDFVTKDADLSYTKAVEFSHYPYGQHAHENFHLHDYVWATPLLDLGQFIENVIFPKLDDKALHKVEHDHEKLVETLEKSPKTPRSEPPEVGRYRHV